MRVAFVTTGLATGGAELALCRLVLGLSERGVESTVHVLTGEAGLAGMLNDAGVPVTHLGVGGAATVWPGVRRLRAELSRTRPDIVQTWMYHADFIGGMAAWSIRLPVVWGVRNSSLSRSTSKRGTRWLVRGLAVLSHRLPARIIMNAERSRLVHERLGYRKSRIVVIPNGIDATRYRRCDTMRRLTRSALGIGDDQPLVGMLARFDPQKDHGSFLEAARIVVGELPQAMFLLCGPGCDSRNRMLTASIREQGLDGRVLLLGERSDTVELMNALDLHVLTSAYGEAFPNVLGEAMACEVPAVATDVGDSAAILGDQRWIVPPCNPHFFARAWLESLRLDAESRDRLCTENRDRVVREYNLDSMVDRFHSVYRNILSKS